MTLKCVLFVVVVGGVFYCNIPICAVGNPVGSRCDATRRDRRNQVLP